MKVFYLHHCFFLALFVILCPNFSPKRRTQIPSRVFQLKSISELKSIHSTNPHLSAEQTRERAVHLNPTKSAFAQAISSEATSQRRLTSAKSPKQRWRESARKMNRRRQKMTKNSDLGQIFRMVNDDYMQSSLKQRQSLESIWNEINSHMRTIAEESCGTSWTRNANEKSVAKFQPHKTYGTLVDSTQQLDRNRRHVTHVTRITEPSAVYFSGRSILKQTDLSFKSTSFTVELWVKPDGGQSDPAVILNGGNALSKKHYESKWKIGISSPRSDSKPRFFFSRENKDRTTTTIHSPYAYKPEEWAHLTVSSDGGVMRLYVNGVQVGARHDPREELSRRGAKCDAIILGGNDKLTQGYRGLVDKLAVWSGVRPQPDISDDMYNLDLSQHINDVVTSDDFDVFRNWKSVGSDEPMIWNEDVPEKTHRIHFPEVTTPPCGQTICDNPDIVKSYAEHWWLRRPKTLRYNVVNINEDDGTQPMFTANDVIRQAALLTDAFGPHNITWVPTLVHVNNSRLRRKTIGCEPSKIGNRQCDIECNHARMGYDGGDCDMDFSICEESKKGNGHCDQDCNKLYHNWDLGDCCDPRYTDTDETCFDPRSANRAYISIAEYKSGVAGDNSRQLSVLFANWSNPNSIGVSTFPWDKDVFNSQGGTVMQLRTYNSSDEIAGLVHEFGHNLGLLHVHHGAHNVDCDDACAEFQPSMMTGDLCEDTNPTPMNTNCEEPTLAQAMCSIQNFSSTPFRNFMSYADGSCQDDFTPQQRARMHCYIDLFYNEWSEESKLAPIALPPKVIDSSTSRRLITLSWAPPVDSRVVTSDRLCDSRCMPGKRLRQYAVSAQRADLSEGDWSSRQATGPPDQEACALDGIHFWIAAWDEGAHFDCRTRSEKCALDLAFENAVIPSKLRIWVSYGTDDNNGIKSVELLHEDNTKTIITGLHASCDAPLSIQVVTRKLTRRIRVRVAYPITAIDAVEMISDENEPLCSGCKRIKYKIHRNPPFPNDLVATTELTKFTDKSCEEGVTYSYSVQPYLPPLFGDLSPPVSFQLGQTFCGDGVVQTIDVSGVGEECDDGNNEDEDGCTSTCQTEEGFHCKGEPSVCYWYDGDGQCEEFERTSDTSDCAGVLRDTETQWAIEASSSSVALEALFARRDSFSCRRTNEVLGSPNAKCSSIDGTWLPCSLGGLGELAGEHWLRVVFEKAVLPSSVSIYHGLIAENSLDYREEFSIQMPEGEVVSTGPLTLSCANNPVTVSLGERISVETIKELTIKFRFHSTSIDAIGLTSASTSAPRECVMDRKYENATVTCQITDSLSASGFPGTSWSHDTRCFISCNKGYLPKSTQRITCRNGVWDSAAECVPISCGAPSHVNFASFDCESGYKLNDVCNFTCWSTARMVGEGNAFVCSEDGSWSVPSAQCRPTCGRPPMIGFASSLCNELENKISVQGETCKYRCRPGYHVTQSPSRRSFRRTCDIDGSWKGPACQPVLCQPIPTIHRGRYSCSKGLLFGSVCVKSCSSLERNETITCESSGRWSSSFSLCSDVVTSCEYPRGPAGVEIICDGLSTGKTCKANCVLREGSPPLDIVALSSKSHEVTDIIDTKTKILVCTGESWFPNPEDLLCVQPCDPQLKGNGFCDARNNLAHCDWDGGDCCLRGRKRGPMASPCGQADNGRGSEDIDWTRVKSPTPRTTNRFPFSNLREVSATMSIEDGKRRKRRRRRRQGARNGRDDSRKKHKNRKKHSGSSRRKRKQRKSRG